MFPILQGQNGPPGIRGSPGKDGSKGSQGEKGAEGQVGKSGGPVSLLHSFLDICCAFGALNFYFFK